MGVLRANVGGQWIDIANGPDEVYVGTDDPSLLYPSTELWYDTDETSGTPVTITPWTVPTLLNSWIPQGAPYQGPRYRKIGDMVYLEGMVKSGTWGSTIFMLPAAFCPPADLYFGTVSAGVFGAHIVMAGGNVLTSAGSNTWFSINCSFSTVT